MINHIPPEEFAGAIRASVRDLFSTMLDLPLEDLPPRQIRDEPGPFDGVIALVGVAGSWTGSGRISCSPQFARRMAEVMLMSEYPAVNEEVLDAVAEVGNMIIGNIKTIFEEKLGPLGLSVPTVIYGHNYQAHSAGITEWTLVPFRSGEEIMNVSFCLVPSRSHAHPAPHAGSLQTA